MIDAFKALGWLNVVDSCSHLDTEDRRLIGSIGRLGLFDSRIEAILERLRISAHSHSDSLRKAEVLLYCAAIGHSRGWNPQAARDAIEAVISYDMDHHRCAVARWILGIMQWEMLQNHDAYQNWAGAKRMFQQCQTANQRAANAMNWYTDPIFQMDVELIARPEEISTWINCFERSSLGIPTGQIVNRVRENVRQRAYPSIYVLMQDLQQANNCSERLHERAEIYLEFGLATYQLGNSYFAIDLLRNAVLNFYPGIGTYHKQVVARCMLGALEWMHKACHNQAAADWMRCIDEFEKLQQWANRDNFHQKAEWYERRCEILRAALLEWVKPPNHADPKDTEPQGQAPQPVSRSPAPGKTDLYQELLAKVNWDRAMADCLIEFERKKAPTADRNELIRRAIERWLRDNQ
jgi:tetratricopeptide (TPR) repeat protein